MLPDLVAHADWGSAPSKRVAAIAQLDSGRYEVVSLAAVGDGDLLARLRASYRPFQAVVGFDFPIGLPRAYARAAGVESFTAFLGQLGAPPWEDFGRVAEQASEISLRRPFYPARPGGTRRAHLSAGLGLSAAQLRRRCDGTDAETLFWTLGGKQAGKAALHGWELLRRARAQAADIALWPFDGSLPALLAGPARFVVAEAYPREFYRYFGAPPRARWSKRRREDRLLCIPALLSWANRLGVGWDAAVLARVTAGCSAGPSGEDEFDAIAGVLGTIAVVTGVVPAGVPADDDAVVSTEGWILGRAG